MLVLWLVACFDGWTTTAAAQPVAPDVRVDTGDDTGGG
jgi:hypothetical protein